MFLSKEKDIFKEYGKFSKAPLYMVSGTRDNPPCRGNFIERLYEKKLTSSIIHEAF